MIERLKEILNKEYADPLELIISSERNNNRAFDYIICKIISQLEIWGHIYCMGPVLHHAQVKDVLLELYDRKEPKLWKKIIEKDKTKIDYISHYESISPENEIQMMTKLGKKKIDIIVDYYYTIPETIKKSNKESSNEELILLKNQYYNEIIKLYSNDSKNLDLGKYWYEFYQNHEKDLLDWIKINENMIFSGNNDEEIKNNYKKICIDYFHSLSHFEEYVFKLKKDILGLFHMYKYLVCNNLKKMNLNEILLGIRTSMEGMIDIGENVTLYRKYELDTCDDLFFKYTSKSYEINNDIDILFIKYEDLKITYDNDAYIKKAIRIFQDFIRIHPYQNGNGRTSRFLLDCMMLNREILPPLLYRTYYDRWDLDNPSHDYTMRNNIKPIEEFVIQRINKTKELWLT